MTIRTSRRAFLAALAPLSALASGLLAADDALAAVLPRRRRVGLQLYTVRSAMEKDVARTLARVARVGYQEVEFAGYFGLAPARVRALLDANGLAAPAAHLRSALFSDDFARELDAAKAIGHEWVVLPWIDAARRHTLDDLRRTAADLMRAAEAAKAAGLRFAYHNHDFDFAPVEGRVPYDLFLAETDAALVKMELDVYYCVMAGADPLRLFAEHPGRFTMIHAKDSSGPPAHRMTEVGSGTIDWPRILAAAEQAGVEHVFAEHDEPKDPFASIAASYRYLSRLK